MLILVDTSAWIALENLDDARHVVASRFWNSTLPGLRRILITPWILSESITNIARKMGSERALQFGRGLLDSRLVEMVPSSPEVASRALLVMQQRGDPKFSFADAASWVVAREHAVDAVFAFDLHLRIPGIQFLPEDSGWAVREKAAGYRVGPRRMRKRRTSRISAITARHSSSVL